MFLLKQSLMFTWLSPVPLFIASMLFHFSKKEQIIYAYLIGGIIDALNAFVFGVNILVILSIIFLLRNTNFFIAKPDKKTFLVCVMIASILYRLFVVLVKWSLLQKISYGDLLFVPIEVFFDSLFALLFVTIIKLRSWNRIYDF